MGLVDYNVEYELLVDTAACQPPNPVPTSRSALIGYLGIFDFTLEIRRRAENVAINVGLDLLGTRT